MSFSDGYFEGGYISDGYCGGSMSYCSQADLVARFGLTELTQLSNRDDTSMQSMTIFGAASSVGVVSVAVGAVEASATVAVGDTAAVIAANLALALGAVANAMITVSVSGGQVFL